MTRTLVKTSAILTLVLGTSGFAAGQLRSAKALHTVAKANSYEATLDAGFHFNEKAPNGIQVADKLITPYSIEPHKLSIAPLPKDLKNAKVHLYVCDDASTFCETHTLDLGKPSASHAVKPAKATAVQINEEGFILNDLGEAEARAQKSKTIILADFGARWCPSCLRLEDEIFKSENFQKETANIVKVKIDVDLFTNAVLMDKYSVHGFPSTLLLNSQGDEILRFTDYQPWEKIKPLIADAVKNPTSIRELEAAKAGKDFKPEQANLLANRYFESGQNDKAVALMDLMGSRPSEYLDAKVERSIELAKKDPIRKSRSIDEIKSVLQAEGGSTRSLRWRSELVDLLKDNKVETDKLADEADVLTDHLLKDPEILKKALENDSLGEYTGFERFYVAFTNAEIAESADRNAEKAWAKAYTEGKNAKISPELHGTSLRLLTTAMLSHQPNEALGIVEGLIQKYPTDGDLKRRKLKILVELKKYKEATVIGEEALKNSYGTNEFFVVEPLAQAYLGEQENGKARSLLTKYLARNEMQFSNMENSRKKLETLLKKAL
jgi:thioredoxin-like negative regulator of GroEL